MKQYTLPYWCIIMKAELQQLRQEREQEATA
jgi:hypothetical protein